MPLYLGHHQVIFCLLEAFGVLNLSWWSRPCVHAVDQGTCGSVTISDVSTLLRSPRFMMVKDSRWWSQWQSLLGCYNCMHWTYYFSFTLLAPPLPFPSPWTLFLFLDTVLSWIAPFASRLWQDASHVPHELFPLPSYLWHASPSPLLYHLCAHQMLRFSSHD